METGKTAKENVERTSGPTTSARGFRGSNLLLTTVGAAGLAILSASCSKSSGETGDAGACKMVKDDAGMEACSSGCELALVPGSSKGVKDGGVAPSTVACVPKQRVDASVTDTSESETKESEDTEPSSDVEKGGKEAGVASKSDAAVPVCTATTKLRAWASVGRAWEIGGYQCQTNGSPSKFDDGDTPNWTTDTGEKAPCSVAVTNGPLTVTATCTPASAAGVDGAAGPVVFTAVEDGCVQLAGGVVKACADADNIALNGSSTTVLRNFGSVSVIKATGVQSDRVMLAKDPDSAAGPEAVTRSLDPTAPATAPVTAKLSSLGVGADGKLAVAGQITGLQNMTLCGTPLPDGQPVQEGPVALEHEGSQTDVGPGSEWKASPTFGGSVFPGLVAGGASVNFGGQVVTIPAAMTNGTYAAVEVQEQGVNCVIPAGQDSNTACGVSFNGTPVVLPAASAVSYTSDCPAPKVSDGGAPAAKTADASVVAPKAADSGEESD